MFSEQDHCILEETGIPSTNWYSVMLKKKKKTSDSAPTMQGTEGTLCSEDKDRTLGKKNKAFF